MNDPITGSTAAAEPSVSSQTVQQNLDLNLAPTEQVTQTPGLGPVETLIAIDSEENNSKNTPEDRKMSEGGDSAQSQSSLEDPEPILISSSPRASVDAVQPNGVRKNSKDSTRHIEILTIPPVASPSGPSARNRVTSKGLSRSSTVYPTRLPEPGMYLPTEIESLLDDEGFPIEAGMMPEDILASDPRGQELLGLIRAQSELSDTASITLGRRTFRSKKKKHQQHPMMSETGAVRKPDLVDTFRHMQFRKMERQRTGKYKSSNITAIFWTTFTVILFLALLGLVGGTVYGGATNLLNLLVVIFVFPLIFSVVIKITLLYRVVFYEFLLGVVAYVSLNLAFVWNPPPEYKTCPLCNPAYGPAVVIIVAVTSSVMGFTMLCYIFARHIYPTMVKNYTIGSPEASISWWRLTPMREPYISPAAKWAWGKYSYEAFEPNKWGVVKLTFSYRGSIGPDGKPHGWGEWKDSAFAGECLTGWWENGIPVGPFRSRETGTGNAFKVIRVGFVSCANKPWEDPTFTPARSPKGLAWGFAAVECSIAGSFFSSLPNANPLIMPTYPEDNPGIIDEVIEGMNAGMLPLENETGHQAVIEPAFAARALLNRRPSGTEISQRAFRNTAIPVGMAPSAIEEQEALVFVPGFNSNSKWSIRTLAQLLTYAEFPERIKPFVFSWPGGRELSFYLAKAMAMDPGTHECFIDTLKELGRHFRKIHLVAHSMGPRIALGICDRLGEIFMDIEEIRNAELQSVVADENEDDKHRKPMPKPRLMTLTLLNSESPMKSFVNHQFHEFRRYTDLITVYTDQEDGALGIAEFFTRRNWFEPKEPDYRALGYTTGGLYHKVPDVDMRTPLASSSSAPRTEVDLEKGLSTNLVTPAVATREDEIDLQVLGGGVTGKERASWDGPSTDERTKTLKTKKRWLDLDVIDTTLLKVNVQSLRHAYFALQRSLVDDLFDIVCRGLRARERERLLHVDYNLYSYLVAPPFVDSVNE